MTHTELKLTPDGPKVIEVNARLGGDLIPYLGSLATGVDPGVVAADVACGRTPVIAPDRALVAAVRFGYVTEPDTTIGSVAIDRSALPGAVTDAVALLGPGDLASPPPAGTLVGRVSYTVAVAETAARCRAALDTAREAVTVVPADLAALR